jgi:hypothetical protein
MSSKLCLRSWLSRRKEVEIFMQNLYYHFCHSIMRHAQNCSVFCNRHFRLILAGILVLALCVRVGYWLISPTLARDAVTYLYYAEHFTEMSSHGFWSPLFIWYLHLMSVYGYDPVPAGIVLNIVAGVMTVLVIYNILQECGIKKLWCILSSLLAATNPFLVQCSVELLRESSSLLFFSLSCCEMVKYLRTPNNFAVSLAGVFGAFAFLCRYETLEIAAYSIVMIIAVNVSPRFHRKSLCCGILLYAGCLAGGIILLELVMGLPADYVLKGLEWRL